jgi:DNA mismatch repair protein MutL
VSPPTPPLATATRIALLSPLAIDQIAAGEVVERPASVVKELVDNAIDAGATRVDVELEEGGLGLIAVRDNGRGIHPDDLILAVTRHATSKLRDPSELTDIGTLGFRGEALASVAAVARLDLRSRQPHAGVGAHLHVRPGEPPRLAPAGMPVGTQVEVRGLFANLPARRKFMRAEATEVGQCSETVLRLAVVHPEVHLTLRHGKRELLQLPRGTLSERVAQVLERRVSGPLFHFAGEEDGTAVQVWLPTPEAAARGRGGPYLIVRRRVVRERSLAQILGQAYGVTGEVTACAMIEPPRASVDVNVHPQKSEVRFSDPQRVYAAVRRVLAAAVAAAPWAPAPAVERGPSLGEAWRPEGGAAREDLARGTGAEGGADAGDRARSDRGVGTRAARPDDGGSGGAEARGERGLSGARSARDPSGAGAGAAARSGRVRTAGGAAGDLSAGTGGDERTAGTGGVAGDLSAGTGGVAGDLSAGTAGDERPAGTGGVAGDLSAGTAGDERPAGTGRAGRDDLAASTGGGEVSVGTGRARRNDLPAGTGRYDLSVGTGRYDMSAGTGRDDLSAGTGRDDLAARTGSELSAGTARAGRDELSAGTGLDASGGAVRPGGYRLTTRALASGYGEHKREVMAAAAALRPNAAPPREPEPAPEPAAPGLFSADQLAPPGSGAEDPEDMDEGTCPPGQVARPPARAELPQLLTCLPGPVAVFAEQGALLAVDLRRLRSHLVYLRLQRDLIGRRTVAIQGLLAPAVVRRAPEEVALIAAAQAELRTLGVDLDRFGDDAVVVRGVPAHLRHCVDDADVGDLIARIVPWLRMRTREGDAAAVERGLLGAIATTRGSDPAPRLARRWLGELLDAGATLAEVPGLRRWTAAALLGVREPRSAGPEARARPDGAPV